MKKKSFIISILLLMIFMISACRTTITTKTYNTSTTKLAITYNDGTYTGAGEMRDKGYEDAIVVIKGGVITSITLRRLNTEGVEVNYEVWNGEPNDQGVTYPNLNEYRVDLAEDMLEVQSPDVDAITGATDSSNGWKDAVREALSKAVGV